MWILAERTRNRLVEINRVQTEVSARVAGAPVPPQLSGDGSALCRAMASRDPAAVFAEAAERGEVDPLTDADVRLWMGMRPL
jgi:hypothetical protein